MRRRSAMDGFPKLAMLIKAHTAVEVPIGEKAQVIEVTGAAF